MANTNAPAGFKAVGSISGGDYVGKMMKVAFAAGDGTAAFIGSMVKFSGAVDTDGVTPVVTVSASGGAKNAGAIQSFAPQTAGNWNTYNRAASTRMYAYIPADPECLYMVQEDSVGGNMNVATVIGQNADFTTEVGNTTLGTSTMQLDSSTAANTATLSMRLVSPVNRSDNDATSASSNGAWIVKINLDAFVTVEGT